MMKTQIGLGVLSIPAAFDVLGLIPGLIILITIAAITTWSNYIVGVFKLLHPGVYSLDDAGAMIFGRAGRYFFATTFCLCKSWSSNASIWTVLSLTNLRLGFGCWLWYVEYIDRSECRFHAVSISKSSIPFLVQHSTPMCFYTPCAHASSINTL